MYIFSQVHFYISVEGRVCYCIWWYLKRASTPEPRFTSFLVSSQHYGFEKLSLSCICWCWLKSRLMNICGILPHGMWALGSPIRDQTRVSCIGRRILNHWTTREVSQHFKVTVKGAVCAQVEGWHWASKERTVGQRLREQKGSLPFAPSLSPSLSLALRL